MLDFVSFCIDFDFCVGTVRFSGMNLMRKIEHGATPTCSAVQGGLVPEVDDKSLAGETVCPPIIGINSVPNNGLYVPYFYDNYA